MFSKILSMKNLVARITGKGNTVKMRETPLRRYALTALLVKVPVTYGEGCDGCIFKAMHVNCFDYDCKETVNGVNYHYHYKIKP
jgi:hypothetical protein